LGKHFERSEEQQTILEVYGKVMENRNNEFATPTFIVVSGQPGVGKTALATGIQDVVQHQDGGFFACTLEI
jgi:DNA replication protein DnaC